MRLITIRITTVSQSTLTVKLDCKLEKVMKLAFSEQMKSISEIDTQHRLSYGLAEVSAQTGLSTAFLRKEARAGNLKTKKFGARRLVLNEDLQNYLNGENQDEQK